MRRFAAAISISDTVLVKYELWPALIQHLTARGTRVHLVAARFDAGRHPMSAWGWFIRRHMQALRTILVQDAQSAAVAKSFGVSTSVMGDPRLDRVASNVLQAPRALGRLASLARGGQCLAPRMASVGITADPQH